MARSTRYARVAVIAGVAFLLVTGLVGCAAAQTDRAAAPELEAPVELGISAATTLKKAFEELAPAFEQTTGATIVYNFGASGVLQKQIEGGADVDVFVSASPAQVDTLTAEGFVAVEDASTFISNELIIAVPKGNPAGITAPEDLAKADKLTTGNPESAPTGTKTKEWLMGLGAWDELVSKFVYGENAAQVTDYVARGEVDAAIMFTSEATGRDDIEVVYTVPSDQIKPIKYVAAPLKAAPNHDLAKAFVEFLVTPEARQILISNGFVAYEPK